MPFQIPTLEETRQQVGGDIEAHLPGTEARTRRSVLGVLAFALAGAIQGMHAHIDNRWRNMLPDELADAEGVERWARRFRLWYRDPTAAVGSLQVSGASGGTLLAGTQYQYGQGAIYVTTADLVLAGSVGTVPVEAQTAGAVGNLPAGAKLTLLSPVAGIQSAALVAEGGITGGAEQESLDGLRERVGRRMAEPPQGGSIADYVTWALESHPTITRAWVTEHEQGGGSVVVRIVCDNQESPVPSDEIVSICDAYIAERRPAGRRSVYVLPPAAAPVAYEIHAVPNTASVRAAIEAELRDLHRRDAVPGGTLLISRIREAVSVSSGESDNTVVSPVGNLVFSTGQMPVFGDITWV